MSKYHITAVVISFVNGENTKLLFTIRKSAEVCFVTVASLKLRRSGVLTQPSGSCHSDSTLPYLTRTYFYHLIILRRVTRSFSYEVASLRVVILQLFIECRPHRSFILPLYHRSHQFFICSSSGYQVTWERSTWETGVGKQCVDSQWIQINPG